jgi:hypothetical protein
MLLELPVLIDGMDALRQVKSDLQTCTIRTPITNAF